MNHFSDIQTAKPAIHLLLLLCKQLYLRRAQAFANVRFSFSPFVPAGAAQIGIKSCQHVSHTVVATLVAFWLATLRDDCTDAGLVTVHGARVVGLAMAALANTETDELNVLLMELIFGIKFHLRIMANKKTFIFFSSKKLQIKYLTEMRFHHSNEFKQNTI